MTSAIVPTYARADITFERGDGCWLTTTDGERYLDFGAGIAVNSLGHSHPHLVETLIAQGSKLWVKNRNGGIHVTGYEGALLVRTNAQGIGLDELK